MDDKSQKERLEQELRFLKESFEAEVISKEEYEKGKDRIEKKLKDIKNSAKEQSSEEPKEQNAENQASIEEEKSDNVIKAPETGKIELTVIQDETENHEHFEPVQIKVGEKETIKESTFEKPKTEIKEEKKKSKFFKSSVVFFILVLIIFFSYSFLKNKTKIQEKTSNQMQLIAICSSNEDCKQEGKEGFCLNSGTFNAKCEFKDIQKINVLVLNDRKNCFNCDTGRVLSILESWFGAINAKEIDYNTEEGKNLGEKFDAKLLPMYILHENITKKTMFDQFRRTFFKKDGVYVLSEDAAASTFYFKRDNVPNKLDLFVISGDNTSIKAEKNLKEFLEAFKEVKFDKHLSNDKLAEELGIKTFPTFLVNNRVKFSGVHTAETIKNSFCKLNKLAACEKSLSKNLV